MISRDLQFFKDIFKRRLNFFLNPAVQQKAAGRGRINYDWVDCEKGDVVAAVDGNVMAMVMASLWRSTASLEAF